MKLQARIQIISLLMIIFNTISCGRESKETGGKKGTKENECQNGSCEQVPPNTGVLASTKKMK